MRESLLIINYLGLVYAVCRGWPLDILIPPPSRLYFSESARPGVQRRLHLSQPMNVSRHVSRHTLLRPGTGALRLRLLAKIRLPEARFG